MTENEKIGKLSAYFNENTGNRFCDWEWIVSPNPELLSGLVPRDAFEFLLPILKDDSESMICIWKLNATENPKQSFVWLDSEGEPCQKFALNVDEFISLLPYGSGGLYDIILNIYINLTEIENVTDSSILFNSEQIESYIINQREQYGNKYEKFRNFITSDLKIKISKNPAIVIQNAIKSTPDFKKWIKAFH